MTISVIRHGMTRERERVARERRQKRATEILYPKFYVCKLVLGFFRDRASGLSVSY